MLIDFEQRYKTGMKIEIHQPLSIHEIGKRDNQEDALWRKDATADDRLFIVCDGMGGHEKGEVASQTFSEALGKWYSENANPDIPLDNKQLDEQLSTAIEFAYKQLDAQDDGSFKKMGTTLTLLYIHARGVLVAHIGDSRIYHIRPSERILYQSRDHSLVYDLYQAGEIGYEEMATHPQKNVITKAVTPGEENRATPDIIHITDIEPDDYFYMCSDGMLERMSNGELLNIFSAAISDDEKRQNLIYETEDNADNHTAWIIRIKSVLKEAGDATDENEETTARCNALNIRPAKLNEEVQIADTGDVQVVGMAPSRMRKGKSQQKHGNAMNHSNERHTLRNKIKRWLYPVLCCLALVVVSVLVYQSVFKGSRQKVKNLSQIHMGLQTDTLDNDSLGKVPLKGGQAKREVNIGQQSKQQASKEIVHKKDNKGNTSTETTEKHSESKRPKNTNPHTDINTSSENRPEQENSGKKKLGVEVRKATEEPQRDVNSKPVDIINLVPPTIDTQE